MTGDDAPQGDSFDERARTLNSNLQHLIEAVGDVLSTSGDLLGRLQRLLGGSQPPEGSSTPSSDDDPPDDPHPGRRED